MSNTDYSALSRLLHRLALQSKAISEISFDIENALTKNSDRDLSDKHIFISGLARSGTTMLMRYLYETGFFRSLTYLDMPFVLMPNLWKRLSFKTNAFEYKERIHKDGIMVGYDSPEAFEEVFWRVFCGEKYIRKDKLVLHQVSNDVSKKFKKYINNVLLSSGSTKQIRYISKNNNNILRLKYLQANMPNAYIIIPFRDPLQHAISLLDQHLHFLKVQNGDKFSLDYMNWLGHFEFGLGQRSFYLDDEDTFREMEDYDKCDINFWLANWKNYYKYVNDNYSKNTIIFSYESFCQNPSKAMAQIFKKIDINLDIRLEPFKPTLKIANNVKERLLEECNHVFDQLNDKFKESNY